jgi:hypothetical protein
MNMNGLLITSAARVEPHNQHDHGQERYILDGLRPVAARHDFFRVTATMMIQRAANSICTNISATAISCNPLTISIYHLCVTMLNIHHAMTISPDM